jgi:hypothetical protein
MRDISIVGVLADIRSKQFRNASNTVTASAILLSLCILRSYVQPLSKKLFLHPPPHKIAVRNVNVVLRKCHLCVPVFAHEFVN